MGLLQQPKSKIITLSSLCYYLLADRADAQKHCTKTILHCGINISGTEASFSGQCRDSPAHAKVPVLLLCTVSKSTPGASGTVDLVSAGSYLPEDMFFEI